MYNYFKVANMVWFEHTYNNYLRYLRITDLPVNLWQGSITARLNCINEFISTWEMLKYNDAGDYADWSGQ